LAAAPALAEIGDEIVAGQGFRGLARITSANVGKSRACLGISTGFYSHPAQVMALTKFDATPLVVRGQPDFCSRFTRWGDLRSIPAAGAKWRYDRDQQRSAPAIATSARRVPTGSTIRPPKTQPACARVFMGTNDVA